MTRTLTALAAVAAMTIGSAAIAQDMMSTGEGYDMLSTAIANDFERLGIPTDTLDDLTLGQIAAIKAVLEEDSTSEEAKNEVEAIIANN